MLRTSADTGLTLDADAGDAGNVLRVDGAHRTERDALSAFRALRHIGQGLRLQELGRLTVRALRDIVGRGSIARNRKCRKVCLLRQGSRVIREGLCRCQVLRRGTSACQEIRESVAACEGCAAQRPEAACRQHGDQLRETVVKAAVSEGHHRHRRGAVSLELCLEVRQDLVRELAGVRRGAHHHQSVRRKFFYFSPRRRGREILKLHGTSEILCQLRGYGLCNLLRISRRTEINTTDLCDHRSFLL